jgi:hypothetical protein
MMRRRRPTREIAFSFDSFLDLVANVVGIIIRLILVVWVGARSYTPAPVLPPPALVEAGDDSEVDNSLRESLSQDERKLADAQAALLEQLRQLKDARESDADADKALASMGVREQGLQAEKGELEQALTANRQSTAATVQSLSEMRQRYTRLAEEAAAVRQLPPAKQALRYRTPVSQPVHAEEVLFECQQGRVCFIDIHSLLEEMRGRLSDHAQELRSRWAVDGVAGPVGAFRLHYTIERQRGALDNLVADGSPDAHANFNYGLSGWMLEPILPNRGETAETALTEQSDFRQIVDALDARHAVVTFWVYPDSFALFRQLRDYLYERDIVVAGRPLPMGVPIVSSRHGTVSRGQ